MPARTCLVVDDSVVVRKVSRRILEDAAFIVAEAVDGRKALEACRQAMPDIILLDWNMPVMNGIEFLKALRDEFGPDNPPVLFCTTETEMSFIEQAIEYGAQEFIMKPFDKDILLGKLGQVGLL
jgi:two-component system chemotaxis response regulator CheY